MAGITLGMKAAAKAGGEGAADQIARLLREGRAAEVTDEMLGALGPNEQAKLFELYESGATGMDLPMDEASRLARAARGGFNVDDTRYHGTKDSIAAFDPAKTVDGSVHLGSRPEQANMRTYGEGANLIPAYLREGKMRRSRDSDGYWKAKAKSARRAGTDTVEYLNRYEGIPRERFDSLRESGSLSRLDSLTDAQFRRAVPEAADSYLVMDPANIRSRHARFDPRLSKNADLLASRAPVPGAGGVMATRPTSPAEPSGDGPSLSDVLGRLKQAFGLAGRAGIEGMNTALSGVDEQGRSVGSILPFAKDERTGEVGLASPRILDLWNTAGGVVPAKGVTLGAGPVVRAADSALDMSQEARMARAREMGFDVDNPVYHGTMADFEAFDLNKAGSRTDSGHLGVGIYTSTDPRVGNTSDVVIPLSTALDSPLRIELPDFRTDKKDVVRNALGLEPTATAEEVTNAARKHGYDGVILDYAPSGYSGKEVVTFDPSRVRSVHAAFDPAKRDSADLLASRAAPGSLGIGGERRLTYRDIEGWL